MTSAYEWLPFETVVELHAKAMTRFGGASGLRDEGGLRSALARPQQIRAYEPDRDLAAFATAYAAGISQNHPFVDGNGLIAFITIGVFLELNGHFLDAPELEAYEVMMRLSKNEIAEDELASWVRRHMAKSPD